MTEYRYLSDCKGKFLDDLASLSKRHASTWEELIPHSQIAGAQLLALLTYAELLKSVLRQAAKPGTEDNIESVLATIEASARHYIKEALE